jgi:hypothetical protein
MVSAAEIGAPVGAGGYAPEFADGAASPVGSGPNDGPWVRSGCRRRRAPRRSGPTASSGPGPEHTRRRLLRRQQPLRHSPDAHRRASRFAVGSSGNTPALGPALNACDKGGTAGRRACGSHVASGAYARFAISGLLSRGSQVRVLPGAFCRVRRDRENACKHWESAASWFVARRRGDARFCASDDAPGRILVAFRLPRTPRHAPASAM